MAGRDGSQRPRRIVDYHPLPSQRRFHDLATRIKGYSGPVGSGKSAALCHEAIDLAFKNDGRTGLIGAPTYNMLRDATLDAFQEILRASEIEYELNRSSFTLTILECGSRILFRSLDDAERLRGSNLAWFGVDELTYCTEDAWTRLEARLRDPQANVLGGFAVWTPKGFDWVYRRFVGEPIEGYGLVQAEAFENTHLLETTPDYYDRLKASYDEAFYRQEVLGSYLNLQAGQVYYAFDRERNVGDWEKDSAEPLIWSWGGTAATSLSAGGSWTVSQAIAAPASRAFTASAWLKCSVGGGTLRLSDGAGLTKQLSIDSDGEWRLYELAWRQASAEEQVILEISGSGGATIVAYGLQVEPQPGRSSYKRTREQSGVFANAYFDQDSLEQNLTAPNQNAGTVRIQWTPSPI